jgi:membrane protease YdiL (CAAX protease family)
MNDNYQDKMMKKLIKKDFNKLGLTILMNSLIANVVIIICVIIITMMRLITNPNMTTDNTMKILEDSTYSGTMSIVAVIIAFIPFLIYRGRKFFQYDLRVENKKFTVKTVALAIIILLSLNSLLVMFSNALEVALNAIGFSANFALEELETLNQLTIPMIAYSCIIAPIFEEFIYRGAILRSLEKYGKRFAILISATLFGLMHGNFYQIFMAIGVGIILGYLATEYSIKLTILLHIINNVCVQVLSQITINLGGKTENIIDIAFTCISIIVLIIVFIRKRNYTKEWLQNNKVQKGLMLKFFTSILIILVVTFDIFEVISGITKIQ